MTTIANTKAYEEESLHTILYRIEDKLDRLLEDEVIITGSTPDKETMKILIKEMKQELSKR